MDNAKTTHEDMVSALVVEVLRHAFLNLEAKLTMRNWIRRTVKLHGVECAVVSLITGWATGRVGCEIEVMVIVAARVGTLDNVKDVGMAPN